MSILKKIFFINGMDSDEPSPDAPPTLEKKPNEGVVDRQTGEDQMNDLENIEDIPPLQEEEAETANAATVDGPVVDTLQTAPLGVPPEDERSPQSSTLKPRRKEASKEQNLQVVQRSAVGAVRARNEDTSFAFASQSGGDMPVPAFGLFVVADGMGGHYDGHKASKIVSRTVAGHILEKLYLPLLREDDTGPRPPIQEVMEDAVTLANKALYTRDPEKEMGTTLTAALIFGSRLFLVHVGDSRAYLLTEADGLQAITTDHTIVQALQDAGQLTEEEAAVHPNRHLLYRALMGEELEQVDVFTQSLPAEGKLCLCSDGLWGLVGDEALAEILTGPGSLADKADNLVEEAMEAGGHDNITLILVEFDL